MLDPDLLAWWPTAVDVVDPPASGTFVGEGVAYGPSSVSWPLTSSCIPADPIAGLYSQFDPNAPGTPSYIQVPASPKLNFGHSDFTVEGWIYWDPQLNPSSGNIVIGNGTSFSLMLAPFNDMHLHVPGQIIRSNELPPPCEWSHIAVRRMGGMVRFFIDGEGTSGFGFLGSTEELSWADGVKIGDRFGGAIEDLAIWGRALADHEIVTLSEGPKSLPPPIAPGGLCFLVPWGTPLVIDASACLYETSYVWTYCLAGPMGNCVSDFAIVGQGEQVGVTNFGFLPPGLHVFELDIYNDSGSATTGFCASVFGPPVHARSFPLAY